MKHIVKALLLLFSLSAHAFTLTSGSGEITLVRKKQVTKIDASQIIAPIQVKSDTLIITEDNSFARVVNNSKDILIIGPNSKVSMELKIKKLGSFVALHDGLLRVIAKKRRKVEAKHFDRVFVRTNSIISSVENGDILYSYNLFNNVTGLLAFTGDVSAKKIDKSGDFSAKQRLIYKRDSNNDIKFELRTDSRIRENVLSIHKQLNSKQATKIERGQYSATYHDSRPLSLPVKINPVQFNLLYRNTFLDTTEYSVEDEDNLIRPWEISDDLFFPKEQASSYQGESSEGAKRFAPKAGGLIDLKTGFYLPPEDNAKFNERYKVYVPRRLGYINATNGTYIAHKNLKLDANKGYVVKNKTTESISKRNELNSILKKNLLLASYRPELNHKMTMAERFSTNTVGLSFINQGYSQSLDGQSYDIPKTGIELSLILIGNGSFRPFANFKILNQKYENSIFLSNAVERFYHMNFGVDYNVNDAIYLRGAIEINEESIPLKSSLTLTRATLNNLLLESGVRLIGGKKYNLFLNAGLKYSLENEDDQFIINSGFAYFGGIKSDYWLNRRNLLYFDAQYLNHDFSISGNSNDADVTVSGLDMTLGYRYIF